MGGYPFRLWSNLEMRKGCRGCLSELTRCRAGWAANVRQMADIPYSPLHVFNGITYLACAQILGADVAKLSSRIKKSKIKTEPPQNASGWAEREMFWTNRQKLAPSMGKAHKIITKGSCSCCVSALNEWSHWTLWRSCWCVLGIFKVNLPSLAFSGEEIGGTLWF